MVFDGGYLRGQENYNWNPTDLRTVIFDEDALKFNTTTVSEPENAARLYTLVSGKGTQIPLQKTRSVVITNTPVEQDTDYELPETGGDGTTMYYAGGIILMLSAVMAAMVRKRKQKEN